VNIGDLAGWGYQLLLFPWARNFTPIASCSCVEERLVAKHKSLNEKKNKQTKMSHNAIKNAKIY